MLRVYSLDPQTSVHVRVIRSDSTRIDQEFDLDLRDPGGNRVEIAERVLA